MTYVASEQQVIERGEKVPINLCDTCEYSTAAFNPCNACKDKSEYKPQESEDKE